PAAPLAPPVAGCAAGRRHCSSVWPQAVASVVLQAENTAYPLFQAAAFTAIDLIIKGPLQAHIRFTTGTADVVAGAGKEGQISDVLLFRHISRGCPRRHT